MPMPARSTKFAAFVTAVFMLGVIAPPTGIAVGALIVYWFDLTGPWPTTVLAVTSCATSVLGVLAALRLDDLRRRRM